MLKIIFILLILIGTLGPNDGLVTAEQGNLITILGILLGLYVFISKPIYSLISKKRNNNTLNSKGKITEDTNNMKKNIQMNLKK